MTARTSSAPPEILPSTPEEVRLDPVALPVPPVGVRRLLRSRLVIGSAVALGLLVAACIAAPLWAAEVAGTTPERTNASPDDTVVVDGEERSVLADDGRPIGPTWDRRFFLGADDEGRDVMVRLLYGGRTSLAIGIGAALLTALLAVPLGLVAGYLRGPIDAVVTWALDVIWAFPVVLLGVALGVALALGGLKIGPIEIAGGSSLIPLLVIAVVYIPYMARPIRAQVRSLAEREFVEAARAQGAGPVRIMAAELLPNLTSTIVALVPLLIANAILLEAALSFLGAGVQPPDPSWGTMLRDGIERLTTAPHATLAPGLALVAAVLSINLLGDGVRETLEGDAVADGPRG